MKKIITILPTLNEEKNLNILFYRLKKIDIKMDFIFIDDGSKDRTLEIISKIKKKNKKCKIFLNKRLRRMGIGKAHKDGLNFAYRNKYDYAVTMDTDLAHHPKYIPNLLKLIQNKDLIVGSRFIKKNSVPKWSLFRIALSKGSHFFTRLLFKHDFDATNSFRCYNLKKIKKDFLKYTPNQYDFFFTSVAVLNKKKYKIDQFPMVVFGRSHGSSKMETKHIFRSVAMIFIFYLKLFFIK